MVFTGEMRWNNYFFLSLFFAFPSPVNPFIDEPFLPFSRGALFSGNKLTSKIEHLTKIQESPIFTN